MTRCLLPSVCCLLLHPLPWLCSALSLALAIEPTAHIFKRMEAGDEPAFTRPIAIVHAILEETKVCPLGHTKLIHAPTNPSILACAKDHVCPGTNVLSLTILVNGRLGQHF